MLFTFRPGRVLRFKSSVSLRLPLLVGAVIVILVGISAIFLIGQRLGSASAASATMNKISWVAFNGGGARSGNNTAETTITQANVHTLAIQWRHLLPAVVDGTPVEQPNVNTSGGVKDLLFVTTRAGSLIAVDALTGTIVWQKDHPAGTCTINNGPGTCYTTSSPAIDPSGLYVYTYGLDGYVHKHAIADGAEVTGTGWPELITLKNFDEKGSSPLNIGGGYLYMMTAGYPGDGGDYQGHLVAINLSTGVQHVFNMLCSDQAVHFVETPGSPDCAQVQAGVWARAEAVIDPLDGSVLIVSGNGDYNPASHDYGDTVVKLKADGTTNLGTPLDTYTPSNYATLQFEDADLGSSAPALIPQQQGSLTPYLAVQAGKDSMLRLINRQNLSGQGGPNHTGGEIQAVALPQGNEVLTQPAVWTDGNGVSWVFVANDSGFSAFKVVTDSGGHTALQFAYQNNFNGSSPFVAGNVLYLQSSGVLRALNPTTGAQLWSDTTIGGVHWQSPLVVNGRVYDVDASGYIAAYATPNIPPPVPVLTPSPTPSPRPIPTMTVSATPGSVQIKSPKTRRP